MLIARFMESHGGVTAAAERALEVLTAGGVAEAGVVGLVDDEAEMLRPIAAPRLPSGLALRHQLTGDLDGA